MEEGLEEKVDEALALAHENKKMLKKLLAYRRWAAIYAFLRWIVFLVIALGTYYYLQPYLEQLTDIYKEINSTFGGLKEIGLPGFGQ